MDRNKRYLMELHLMKHSKEMKKEHNEGYITYILKEIDKEKDEFATNLIRLFKAPILEFWYDEELKKGRLSIKN